MSNALAYFNEACIFLSAISLAIGWRMIRKKQVELHKRFMFTGAILAILFFVSYVAKTFFFGDTTFGGPKSLSAFFYTFLQIHSILATIAPIIGIFTLRFAFKRKFDSHRKSGRWAVILWFITAASGLTVFLMLYVVYPAGHTASLLNAWLGR